VVGAERVVRVEPWLDHLHIAHLADRPVGLLSGGEAQRTSFARVLVLEPEVFFLDEPFAALEAPTRARLGEELAEILDERQIATLFVTHDIDEVAALCKRCVVLDAARVLHDDMATVLERPVSRRALPRSSGCRTCSKPMSSSAPPEAVNQIRGQVEHGRGRVIAASSGWRRQCSPHRGTIRSERLPSAG